MQHAISRRTRRSIVAAALGPLMSAAAVAADAQSSDPGLLAALSGTAYDSISQAPLGGAVIEFVAIADSMRSRAFRTTSDRSGHYAIGGLAPGDYRVRLRHPALDSLGMEVVTPPMTVRAGTQRIDLASPSVATVTRRICGHPADAAMTGLLIGHVRDAERGDPVAGASVLIEWMEANADSAGLEYREQRADTRTTDSGWFSICGLPSSTKLFARAGRGGDSTGHIEVEIAAGRLRHLTLHVGQGIRRAVARTDSAALPHSPRDSIVTWSGTARLAGRVRDNRGRPAARASVSVHGTARALVADDRGAFSVDGLPAGTWTVEARLIGFEPTRMTVRLVPGQTATIDLVLGKRITVLVPEIVHARGYVEFERRRRMSVSGSFIGRETIERRGPNATLAQLLQDAPGVIVDNRPGSASVTMNKTTPTSPGSTRCIPSLYVNGVRDPSGDFSFLYSDEIAGIEVYPREISRPIEFSDRNRCGAIAVWTRTLPPEEWKKYGGLWRFVAAGVMGLAAVVYTVRAAAP